MSSMSKGSGVFNYISFRTIHIEGWGRVINTPDSYSLARRIFSMQTLKQTLLSVPYPSHLIICWLKLTYTAYEDSVCSSQRRDFDFIKKNSPFLLYTKMAVQCKKFTEYINTLYGQCAEILVLNLTEPSSIW